MTSEELKRLREICDAATTEIWKEIDGHKGYYEVSNLGNVRALKFKNKNTEKTLLTPKEKVKVKSGNGYLKVGLYKNGRVNHDLVHRVVARAFHGPCPPGFECAHLNGIKHDNRADNLKWVSRKENHAHKWLHGTQQVGENCPASRFTEAQVQTIRIMKAMGARPSEIAKIFGEKTEIICQLINNGWSHLPEPIERLVADNVRLRAALEFYADKSTHEPFEDKCEAEIHYDRGKRAREALKGGGE